MICLIIISRQMRGLNNLHLSGRWTSSASRQQRLWEFVSMSRTRLLNARYSPSRSSPSAR